MQRSSLPEQCRRPDRERRAAPRPHPSVPKNARNHTGRPSPVYLATKMPSDRTESFDGAIMTDVSSPSQFSSSQVFHRPPSEPCDDFPTEGVHGGGDRRAPGPPARSSRRSGARGWPGRWRSGASRSSAACVSARPRTRAPLSRSAPVRRGTRVWAGRASAAVQISVALRRVPPTEAAR
jgi:hypothetical protein